MEGGGEPTWTFPHGPAQGAGMKPGPVLMGACRTGAGSGLDLASSQASGLINNVGTEPGERVNSETHRNEAATLFWHQNSAVLSSGSRNQVT